MDTGHEPGQAIHASGWRPPAGQLVSGSPDSRVHCAVEGAVDVGSQMLTCRENSENSAPRIT